MPRRTIDTLAPVALGPTTAMQTAGLADPAFDLSGDQALVALRLPSGPATLRFGGTGRRFEAEAWGPGAEEALDRAPGVIGAADDPGGFAPDHPVLSRLNRRHPGLRITASGTVTDVLIRAAIGQVVTGKEAKASYRRLVRAVSEPAPGPGELMLPPDPAALAAMPYEEYHPYGIERKRAETIIRIASHAKRMDEAAAMPHDQAYRRMQAVRGVGPWTAALAGISALGDPDAVPVGDYNLPNAVAWLLEHEPRATDERMLELLEPYRGHRGRVIGLIKAAGEKAPRFGPRRQLRNIERI